MNKLIYCLLCACFLLGSLPEVYAQQPDTTAPAVVPPTIAEPAESPPMPENRQLYLDKPAQSVKSIKYKETGELLNGELSKDGKRVFIRNYTHRARVAIELRYSDGTEETIERSPCFIDPAEEM